jgi:diacylglycerol kinase family enzyme
MSSAPQVVTIQQMTKLPAEILMTLTPKSYLFANPASGHHSARNLAVTLEQLRSWDIYPELFRVRTPADIFAHCATINKEGESPLVIVAGGDGTINAVVNGLSPGTATLAVLPFGTSNVMAAEIGITSLEDALERIRAGKTISLSVGVLEMKERSLRFLLMAGIGLDGAVVRDVWPLGKRCLKQGAYALSALRNTFAWDPATFEISSSYERVTCHSAIICNASRYGGNFVLSPENSPFASGLSAVCITGSTRRTYLRCAMDLFTHRTESSRQMTRMHSTAFAINGWHPIQIDGDFVGYGPARITELVNFANIIV